MPTTTHKKYVIWDYGCSWEAGEFGELWLLLISELFLPLINMDSIVYNDMFNIKLDIKYESFTKLCAAVI